MSGPVQIAYAVTDVVEAAHRWAARGVGPFFVREHIDVRRARVRGEVRPFDHSSAYGQWGDLMVELICEHADPDDPDRIVGTSGLHHVAELVDDVEEAAARLVELGYRETLHAETAGGVVFAFHDALAERGHLIEIYEPTPGLVAFYEMVRRAADGWTGDEPVRML